MTLHEIVRPATGTVTPTAGTRLGNVTPNWYAAVMGTGIVAVAGATLPVDSGTLRPFTTAVWLLATAALVAITVITGLHWLRHREVARTHHLDPVMAHFYGAPPMALLTVGTGTLLLGPALIGSSAALAVDVVLWTLGTLLGLITPVWIVATQITRHQVAADAAFGGWLMPVVPPMVSAATGALLIPHLPAGQARLTLLAGCYAMFGLSLLASVFVISMIWSRLVQHGPGPAGLVPTVWIVLGPLGQSVTAAGALGTVAHLAVPAPYSTALNAFAVVYGVPVIGFALLWAALAATLTVSTARSGLPFGLPWWSFTFPVGTCVTGLGQLARHTGSIAVEGAAIAGYAALVVAWIVVATRTGNALRTGELLPRTTPAVRPAR